MTTATPVIVRLYDEPRLYTLVPIAALIFIFAPIGLQFQALLQKEVEFKALCTIESISAVSGLTLVIFFASYGFGPLSLILGQVGAVALGSILFPATGWRRWPAILRR